MMSPPKSDKGLSGSLSSGVIERASTEITRSPKVASNPKRVTSGPDVSMHHLALASEELRSLSDLVKGLKKEMSAYSQIEQEYMQQLEAAMTRDTARELDDNIRMQLTANQIHRLRCYKEEALDELAAVNSRIAQLESRVERISLEEKEAELNVRLYELKMLYGDTLKTPEVHTQNTRHAMIGSGRSASRELPKPQQPIIAIKRKNNRKTSTKGRQAHKHTASTVRSNDAPSSNDLADTDGTTTPETTERPQVNAISDIDASVGNDTFDFMQTTEPAFPSASEPSSPTAAEEVADRGIESNNGGNIVNEPSSVDDSDLNAGITAAQEQSEPLPMPELNIEESIKETGEKKRWHFSFSRGKKKEEMSK